MRVDVEQRFWTKVLMRDDESCWEWLAQLNDGYGYIKVDKIPRRAHILAYEHLVGPVPDGMELDHLCRNRGCVNPAHLEPVTHLENLLRGNPPWRVTQRLGVCKRGHERIPENMMLRTDRPGHYRCRLCIEDRRAA